MKADVIIIGAGAAGLMCAIEAHRRGRKVLLLEGSKKAGKKILISGGGRCNFTNLHIDPAAYISNNPHFCKSALARYTQWDFLAMMDKHQLSWHEKTLGQLFCDDKAPAVLKMLLDACEGITIELQTQVEVIEYNTHYTIKTSGKTHQAESLVIATGGPSIPKMGATDFAQQVAKQFNLPFVPFRPALVPLRFSKQDIDKYFQDLSGVSLEVVISNAKASFREMMLITHKGLTGPAVLQISSYWQLGEAIHINLLPDVDAGLWLLDLQKSRAKAELKTVLMIYFSKRLAIRLADTLGDESLSDVPLRQIKPSQLKNFGGLLNDWTLTPSGTEGLRTAEVCSGGVSTEILSSKTMQVNTQQNLYFIGEAVDVTGWLGGYNFQWAWSSGWAAGQVV